MITSFDGRAESADLLIGKNTDLKFILKDVSNENPAEMDPIRIPSDWKLVIDVNEATLLKRKYADEILFFENGIFQDLIKKGDDGAIEPRIIQHTGQGSQAS